MFVVVSRGQLLAHLVLMPGEKVPEARRFLEPMPQFALQARPEPLGDVAQQLVRLLRPPRRQRPVHRVAVNGSRPRAARRARVASTPVARPRPVSEAWPTRCWGPVAA